MFWTAENPFEGEVDGRFDSNGHHNLVRGEDDAAVSARFGRRGPDAFPILRCLCGERGYSRLGDGVSSSTARNSKIESDALNVNSASSLAGNWRTSRC